MSRKEKSCLPRKNTRVKKSSSTKVNKSKIIELQKCSYNSEKKCKQKNCDTCIFCGNKYCNLHIFDHVKYTHKSNPNIKIWLNDFKKNEYEYKLAKLQEKYEEYLD